MNNKGYNNYKNYNNYKYIHFVGIKGVGMAALSVVAKEMGIKVSGSDVAEDFPTKETLEKAKIVPLLGFKRENLSTLPDLVIVTGAHGGISNVEAVAAKEMGIPVLLHGPALAELMKGKKGLCVSGCHGKTTTAAMISHLLIKSGLDVSYAVGCGKINSLATSGHWGKAEYFIAEADEYVTDPQSDLTPRFLWLEPQIAVVTNIEYDHPDAYPDMESMRNAFLAFAQKSKLVVAGIDNENVRKILPEIKNKVITFGFSPTADFQIKNMVLDQQKTWFSLKNKGLDLGRFKLSVPGQYNCQNAAAAAIVTSEAGVSWDKIKELLSDFSGTKRRFEFIKEKSGILYYDDYAHHPTEVKATLEAARLWFPQKRIIAIFQPHTFSRTKALLAEFSRCFKAADLVILADIFPSAREAVDPEIDSRLLVNEIQKYQPEVKYLGKFEEIIKFLQKNLQPGDVVLTIGAGDIYKLYELLFHNKRHEILDKPE